MILSSFNPDIRAPKLRAAVAPTAASRGSASIRALRAWSIALCVLFSGRIAHAWEDDSTHPGLAETSALSSSLHQRLMELFGEPGGLYAELTIPADEAPELFKVLRTHAPIEGYVPDAKGTLSALSWIAAGSAIADTPSRFAATHFLDASTGRGIRASRGEKLSAAARGASIPKSYGNALEWITSDDNPMGYSAYWTQYKRAVTQSTPRVRKRHLAASLIAAGAMHHVLVDMASPSHSRADLKAHLESLSSQKGDVGSRLERVAALAYGRLGIPVPQPKALNVTRIKEFFIGSSGLATWTATRFFSRGTMPKDFGIEASADDRRIVHALTKALARPNPEAIPLEVLATKQRSAKNSTSFSTWRNASGTCLLRYRYAKGHVRFFTDDACLLEQAAEILPVAGDYGRAFLEHLFRGRLSLTEEGLASVGVPLGKGVYSFYWDDKKGRRSKYASLSSDAVNSTQITVPPEAAVRIVVLFEGIDSQGEELIATGQSPWPIDA